jgi:hypothetical protein
MAGGFAEIAPNYLEREVSKGVVIAPNQDLV